jgi:riboflavin synthase
MFTGLILELGEVVSLVKRNKGARLSIRGRETLAGAANGDSIAINGVCLTVVQLEDRTACFDVSEETLKSTNLGTLKKGNKVNLEPSLRPDSRLGGHFVTGHVEDVGKIRSRTRTGIAEKIEIECPVCVLRFLVEKGSVAVDGISLTVVDVLKDAFSVVIIPHTSAMTTIGFKGVGETVNLEPDILAKYVARFLSFSKGDAKSGDGALMEALMKSGFIS